MKCLAIAALILFAGCYSTLSYVPRAETVSDPAVEFDALVRNNWDPTPLRIAFSPSYVSIVYTCRAEPLCTKVLNFDDVRSIKIFDYRGTFPVAAYDESGHEVFSLSFDDLSTAQRMADVLMALRNLVGRSDEPPSSGASGTTI